jgi:hypothetical protein
MQEPNPINRLIKRLFPLPRRLRLTGSGTERRRARALTVLLLTCAGTVWFWTVILTLLYLAYHFDIIFNVYYACFVSAVLALQVWGFYRFANLRLASMLFTLTYFLMALSLVLMSDGYHSPNLVILLSSPVVAFRAGGKDEGIMNSIFVGLTGLALVTVDKLGVPMLNLLTGMESGFFFAIAWVVTISITATCLVTYDMDE